MLLKKGAATIFGLAIVVLSTGTIVFSKKQADGKNTDLAISRHIKSIKKVKNEKRLELMEKIIELGPREKHRVLLETLLKDPDMNIRFIAARILVAIDSVQQTEPQETFPASPPKNNKKTNVSRQEIDEGWDVQECRKIWNEFSQAIATDNRIVADRYLVFQLSSTVGGLYDFHEERYPDRVKNDAKSKLGLPKPKVRRDYLEFETNTDRTVVFEYDFKQKKWLILHF